MKKKISVNIHAGHNPDGKIACGAAGLIKESTEARLIAGKVINMLREKDVVVYNCTVNNGTGQSDVLQKIVSKCNKNDVDMDVSIHFNSGRNDKKGDGKIGGTEVWVRSSSGIRKTVAEKICNRMEKLGFYNRGVKETSSLYFLNHTKAPALLVEVCFVDDRDDTELYEKDKDAVARAIAGGILKAFE